MLKKSLIVFVKAPILGQVKTRLAQSIGEEKALHVYRKLLAYTFKIVSKLNIDVFIYQSEKKSLNQVSPFKEKLQKGETLGERMRNAFQEQFDLGYESVCIIGSDNFEITSELITNAFDQLQLDDVVIGPSYDGGYYLLGIKKMVESFFIDKEWSTSSVYQETLKDIKRHRLSFTLLKMLHDVDVEKDLKRYPDLL